MGNRQCSGMHFKDIRCVSTTFSAELSRLTLKGKMQNKIDKPVNEAELIRKLEGSKQNKATECPCLEKKEICVRLRNTKDNYKNRRSRNASAKVQRKQY